MNVVGHDVINSKQTCNILLLFWFHFISFLFAFSVGGLDFFFFVPFCVFVAGWRHALRSEWPFTFIIEFFTVLTFNKMPNAMVNPHEGPQCLGL